jgi:MoaA/NifB/PqqE/SkfB family radical SAM enzyme
MAPPLIPDTVVHLHPTLACNLRCGHCYSSSGPGPGRTGLPADRLLAALAILRGEGYRIVSISGGEPFAYRGLDDLVVGAAGQGYRVNLVTNGTLLRDDRLARLASSLSFVAVSIDGSEAHHNRLRGSPTAFARALDGMAVLGRSGVRFGVVMTVSRTTVRDIPDVFARCRAKRAALLSLRPLTAIGRGRSLEPDLLSIDDMARLLLVAQVLDGVDPELHVRTDVVPAAWVVEGPAGTGRASGPDAGSLAARVNPLVIDEDGTVLPFAYGIHPRYHLGTIDDMAATTQHLRRADLGHVQDLVRSTREDIAAGARPYVDWYAQLVHRSHAGVSAQAAQPVSLRPRSVVAG